jgi:hypothetical protein
VSIPKKQKQTADHKKIERMSKTYNKQTIHSSQKKKNNS